MKFLSVSLSLLVLVISAGCAQPRGGGGGTAAMGAGPAQQKVMCRDAAWVTNASECGTHGGVERVMAQ
ncbi:hypothetical protein [Ramlibacter sp. Leaf400]|uniref:hypothetical protein n=1 Tax=Ramlibacter sp. Leaf400 TaxID=1736365 RepID=UPI0006F3225D|nr:hypothetical protein [Ramlibacter sp. Leaf400]KQT13346.1 hypothetical protein ASG30_20540 [Ramlibacter sp. Leaf400]